MVSLACGEENLITLQEMHETIQWPHLLETFFCLDSLQTLLLFDTDSIKHVLSPTDTYGQASESFSHPSPCPNPSA